jgi:hypothetical protein
MSAAPVGVPPAWHLGSAGCSLTMSPSNIIKIILFLILIPLTILKIIIFITPIILFFIKLEITSFPCKSSSPYLDLKSMLYAQ